MSNTASTKYFLHVNGGPAVGWPRVYASRREAQIACDRANERDGVMAEIAEVNSNWTVSPDGEIAWLIGGTAGLRYSGGPGDESLPWVDAAC